MRMRYTGEVHPYVPVTAPLSYRLSEEVYALDGTGCSCKPALGAIALSSPTGLLALVGVAAAIYFMARK